MKKIEREEGFYWVRWGHAGLTDIATWQVYDNGTVAWLLSGEGERPAFRDDDSDWFDSIIPISPRLLPPEA